MTEANDKITERPDEAPRTTDITNELPTRADAASTPERFVVRPPHTNTLWSCAVVGGLLLCIALLGFGLCIVAIEKMKTASARSQSLNNVKQIVLAVNNVASNTAAGDIPPSYGVFPRGGIGSYSFFLYLRPYIEQNSLYIDYSSTVNTPFKTYIAPADPNNPGTNSLISYGSNATVLTVGGQPTLPGSFYGRTSSTIIVFERTAKSGATWSGSNSYLIDSNGSSSPEFTAAASWSNYGSRATALTSAGCVVGMGDGSARIVTQGNANAGWAWAMNPSISATPVPRNW